MRKHRGGYLGKARQPHALERLLGNGAGSAVHPAAAEESPAAAIARLRRDADVLARAQRWKHVTELKRARNSLLRHLVDRPSRDGLAGENNLAGARPQHAGDQVEDGRLAGAVGPDDRADLAGLDRQVDGVDGDQRAEAANEPLAFKQRHPAPPCLRPGRDTARRMCNRLVRMPQMPCGANMTKMMKMVPKMSGQRSVTCER